MGETSAQATARPKFEFAMEASALAQVRFSTQTSAARDGCAEVSGRMCALLNAAAQQAHEINSRSLI